MVAYRKYASCIPLRRVSDTTPALSVVPAQDPRQVRHAALARIDRTLAALEDEIVRQDYALLQLERTGTDTAEARRLLADLQARHAAARERRAAVLAHNEG